MDLSSPEPQAGGEPAAPQPAAPPARARLPRYGEPMRHFTVASDVTPRFASGSFGGLWTMLVFFGSLGLPEVRAGYERVLARRAVFDDHKARLFGVSCDPADRSERGLKNSLPGLRFFWDFDAAVTRLYGVGDDAGFSPTAFILDPGLRIAGVAPLERIDALLDELEALVEAEGAYPELGAPVLTAPRVLEPDVCRAMIDYYDRVGGVPSGFMREVGGLTHAMMDDRHKRRRDVDIDPADPLHAGLRVRLHDRLLPQIERAFCWRATRIERYIVACYSAEDQGFFAPHRDNTTRGTAHRRFAVTINLNDDFDGGELRFPEFGQRTYRPPLGGATVFSCSLLHEATPVRRGVRYATLPFLYDEAGAAVREANRGFVRRGTPDGEG